MANKRMFSLDIVDSDAFLDMPPTSQVLYFHLAMRADDEGFVGNYKRIMKMINVNDDDFKILVGKRFVLLFESGVVVIKHWLIHNTIRMDRFNKTNYQDEKNTLIIKENKAYSEIKPSWQPDGNQMATQVKLSKVKLSKVNSADAEKKIEKKKEKKPPKPRLDIELVDFFFSLKGWDAKNKANGIVYSRYLRPAKQLLELTEGNLDTAKHNLQVIANWANAQKIDWSIETVFKRWHDIGQLPQEKEKKPFIEGRPAYKKGNRWYFIAATGEHFEYVGELNKIIYQ